MNQMWSCNCLDLSVLVLIPKNGVRMERGKTQGWKSSDESVYNVYLLTSVN